MGKAAFSEKPITLDVAETSRVVGLVQEKGFMRRFDPGYSRANAKIAPGELGKLETFRALSRNMYPPSLKLLLSSDALFLDMADLDLARFLVGEVEEAVAVTKSWRENRPFKVSEIQ